MSTDTLHVVAYGTRWNGHLGRLGKELDEADAHRLHESGKLYCALVGHPEQPYAVVEVRLEADFVGVRFLDEQRRTYLDYSFVRPDDGPEGMLFLRQATERRFDGDGAVAWGALHVFDPGGTTEVEEKDSATNETKRYTVEHPADGNWEPVPAFGDYGSVARLER